MKLSTKIFLSVYASIAIALILILFFASLEVQSAVSDFLENVFMAIAFFFPIIGAFIPWLLEALKDGADMKP